MGQAKRRGSREERVAQAEARDAEHARAAAEIRRKNIEVEDARVAAMTPEERNAHYTRRTRRPHLALIGAALALGAYG